MRRRRGFSLIELIAVMSGCSVVLSMSAALLHRAMQTQAQTRYFFESERTALRLSGDFRRDVNRAVTAEAGDSSLADGVFLQLQLDEGQEVEYRRRSEAVVRTLSRAGEPVSREEYLLSSDMEIAVSEEASSRRILLSITTDPRRKFRRNLPTAVAAASIREAPISLQVSAVVGRDRRFALAASGQEASE